MIIRLNVGGGHYVFSDQTLTNHSGSNLLNHDDRLEQCDAFLEDTGEYYFDRSNLTFEFIANFYRTGELHIPKNSCMRSMEKEFDFWNIESSEMLLCFPNKCLPFNNNNYSSVPNGYHTTIDPDLDETEDPTDNELLDQGSESPVERRKYDENPGGRLKALSHMNTVKIPKTSSYTVNRAVGGRRNLWIFLEKPSSSWAARAYSVFIIILILLTVTILVLGSLPQFSVEMCFLRMKGVPDDLFLHQLNYAILNSTSEIVEQLNMNVSTNGTNLTASTNVGDETLNNCTSAKYSAILDNLDAFCVAGFTLDYIMRLIAAPSAWQCFKNPLSIVDLLAIVPFYIEIFMKITGLYREALSGLRRALLIQRTMRIVRVLKMARYSLGVRVIGETLHRSIRELLLLLVYLFLLVTFFSTIVFYLEVDEVDTDFNTIPASAWWALVTFTTVGYGDMVPTSVGGKLVASVATIISVIILAFPVSIIVDNFTRTYEYMALKSSTRRKAMRKRQLQREELMNGGQARGGRKFRAKIG